MRVHLLGCPNTQSTYAYGLDGFNTATIRFAKVLKMMGIPCTLYASEENDAPCDELVTCISKAEQRNFLQGLPYQATNIHPNNPMWQFANPRMGEAIKARKQKGDLICLLGGGSQKQVCDMNPDLQAVEYNIGYHGCFSNYRVYQSQAWRHASYGSHNLLNDGRFFDAVIPGFFETEKFPQRDPEDYIVYVGRLVPKKGLAIACQAAENAGVKLKLIGHGDVSTVTYGELLGPLPEDERNEVVSKARALICPTVYVEPFGCIAPEAMLSGVPVISTDYGGFTETVEHGRTGYRCNLFGEFVDAIGRVDNLDRRYIRARAQALYSLETAAASYAEYFRRIATMWGHGWATCPYEVTV